MRRLPLLFAFVATALVAGACGRSASSRRTTGPSESPDANTAPYTYPRAPVVQPATSDRDVLEPKVRRATETLVDSVVRGTPDPFALETLEATHDARQAWLVADLLRFQQGGDSEQRLVAAFTTLTGVDPSRDPEFDDSSWTSVTDHLIAWDLPAPPGYREAKARLFEVIEPSWHPFFADTSSAIDWRIVSWGGVLIDDRPLGDKADCARGCIPALDDPPLTDATQGGWYRDDAIVFGVVEGDEAVAFPKNIMEVHEMVNITIGGRRLAMPYCTLCGSAQAYYTDTTPLPQHPGLQPVLRTSGLLARSNKVMYELHTKSVFDTFTGRALSGPLHQSRAVLPQTTVVTSRWGDWKRVHPATRIVARDGGRGRHYPADPLDGRDDNGPIFPIGPRDARLPVQAKVVGVVIAGTRPVAFPVDAVRRALRAGRAVASNGVELVADGSGFRARRTDGSPVAVHEAFWFAWSQFHPDTIVWAADPGSAPASISSTART